MPRRPIKSGSTLPQSKLWLAAARRRFAVMPRRPIKSGSTLPQSKSGSTLPQSKSGSTLPQSKSGSTLPQSKSGGTLPQSKLWLAAAGRIVISTGRLSRAFSRRARC